MVNILKCHVTHRDKSKGNALLGELGKKGPRLTSSEIKWTSSDTGLSRYMGANDEDG